MAGDELTVPEAAATIGVTAGRVWQLIGEGRLRIVRRVGPMAILSAAQVNDFARLDRPPGNPNFRGKVKST